MYTPTQCNVFSVATAWEISFFLYGMIMIILNWVTTIRYTLLLLPSTPLSVIIRCRWRVEEVARQEMVRPLLNVFDRHVEYIYSKKKRQTIVSNNNMVMDFTKEQTPGQLASPLLPDHHILVVHSK